MNIGLVLSGGMAKGAYEVGALKAVSEYFSPDRISYVSAASVGVLNAYAYASGRIDDVYQMWRDINQNSDRLFLKAALNTRSLKTSITNLAARPLLCSRFYIPLFNFQTRNNYYIDLTGQDPEKIEDHLRAAVAVFPVCKPVRIDNKSYFDGAMVDNIPVYPLLKHSLDLVICIYFDEYNYIFESEYFDNKIVKISFYDSKEIINKSIWFTKENTEQMFADGYKKAKTILDFVFSKGTENKEIIYSRIEELNLINPKKQVRMTGDIAMKNINKAVRLLTKRKIIE